MVDKTIFLDFFDGFNIQIYIEQDETYFSIEKKTFGNIFEPITHWYPDTEKI